MKVQRLPALPFRLRRASRVQGFVGSPNLTLIVIPAKAGIQSFDMVLDSGFRRSDGNETLNPEP